MHESERELMAARQQKRDTLIAANISPYPNGFTPQHHAAEVEKNHAAEPREPKPQDLAVHYSLAGRVMFLRSFGKASFIKIQDQSGQIQIYCKRDALNEKDWLAFNQIDLGDIVYIEGHPFRTKTGELTVEAIRFVLLTKTLRPMPDKWHGLTDHETRYRQRYVDLMVNEDVRKIFEKRSRMIRQIRHFFDSRDFLEVETPVLQPMYGGAAARPFTTHHHTLDLDLYLRIAPELYLKRLIVGGFERVYEMNKNFRNEGISLQHNPEFTSLEFYWAYATYQDVMQLTEELFREVTQKVCGTSIIQYQGETLDFSKPFERLSVHDALRRFCQPDEQIFHNVEVARTFAKQRGVEVKSDDSHGKIMMALFDALVEKKLRHPTFITDFPLEVSPLSRKKDSNPELVDRFELYVVGRELVNAFSELNDPDDQRQRFDAQVAERARGDEEAHAMDEDYVRALEFGMPPTAGFGLGIDRFAMLLCDVPSIRDVILFPLMRKEA